VPLTDRDYIVGLQANDSNVIKAVYDNFFRKVERFIVNQNGTTPDAEDIFQEVLLSMVKHHSAEIITQSFGAYLIRACKNQWQKKIRKKTELPLTNESLLVHFEKESAENRLEQGELRELMKEKLNQLSPKCKQILLLFGFEGLSYAEITQLLDLTSENATKQQALVCRNKLKELLLSDSRFKDYLD